jgi:dTDP-4-dehydrorhamnose 3,5-epimerase
MSRFKVIETPIKGLFALQTSRIEDDRGYLSRLFCAEEMATFGWRAPLVQINFTKTLFKGTVRGLHFQNPPYAEYKYVRCIRGKVYDVALDLRCGSQTFLKTHSQILTEDNNTSFLIPPGVAHGFQSLSDKAELLYMHSQLYNPEYDDGVNPLDPRIFANWPEEISNMSEKDSTRRYLSNIYKGVKL